MRDIYQLRVFYSSILWELLFVFVFVCKLINLFDYSWWYICVPVLLSASSDFTLKTLSEKNQ